VLVGKHNPHLVPVPLERRIDVSCAGLKFLLRHRQGSIDRLRVLKNAQDMFHVLSMFSAGWVLGMHTDLTFSGI
jgi:hypothetical protein